ncbi:MAG: DUF523 domain-containing protein [Gammaproteobacteria bacterium]|nr:DUF523 domain-containing protein [Gammaproteobacteria bacterium]
MNTKKLPKVAISQCLLGDQVRYDGTDSASSDIIQYAGSHFNVIPFCPEVSAGMGTPRLPINLSVVNGEHRARRVNDATVDVTQALKTIAQTFIRSNSDIVAIINKKSSPSCGHLTTKLYDDSVLVSHSASGIFVTEILKLKPEILFIDDEQFMQAEKRADFLSGIKKALQEQGFSWK